MEERLQKFMARCGVASRRKCEELILSGIVSVNDIIIKELGTKIDCDKDIVKVSGKEIRPEEKKRYIMLNKPEGYISSVKDEHDRQTVIDLIGIQERIFPIGRLDFDSSGLLLLTNDGEIYNKLIHPRQKIAKTYIAIVNGMFSKDDIRRFENGIDIGGYITADAKIEVLEIQEDRSKIRLQIHEGKNRQIRKMCAALNHEVLELTRVSIGEIKLGTLEKGNFRELTEAELNYIKSL
ncbi:pseudouridine synthase [Clostridium folliculivorans]|uniref:Pseudouridine synthase n=1 Tax=Clostridium folliculivorans TaxID=2886038 RepID=A0A9W5Y142_9CLOT|nr:pseudouridine synthase [Clostridium folliculivorans]GKU24703.1 pseudouridine synthase [Clostridium folliculivorans]GKU30801.1 pseudouridine synthase [Clostridium folliculivorans]